jgi:hypothetical protein
MVYVSLFTMRNNTLRLDKRHYQKLLSSCAKVAIGTYSDRKVNYPELFTSIYWPVEARRVIISNLDCTRSEVCELRLILTHIAGVLPQQGFSHLVSKLRTHNSTAIGNLLCETLFKSRRIATHKGFRTRSTKIATAHSLLGYRPVLLSTFARNIIGIEDRRRTNWYRTGYRLLLTLQDFLIHIRIKVTGKVVDPCCGVDESIVYDISSFFPKVTHITLSDLYGKGRHNIDLLDRDDVSSLCGTSDWIITSPPYGHGSFLSKVLENLVVHTNCNLILKLPISALASRELKGKWWNQHIPSHSLICDPVTYEGYARPSINSEIWLIWQKEITTTHTREYNISTVPRST